MQSQNQPTSPTNADLSILAYTITNANFILRVWWEDVWLLVLTIYKQKCV
jgi:hypothetical protein